jgi:hypothetical protein
MAYPSIVPGSKFSRNTLRTPIVLVRPRTNRSRERSGEHQSCRGRINGQLRALALDNRNVPAARRIADVRNVGRGIGPKNAELVPMKRS